MSEATICRTCLRLRQDLCDGEKGQTACQWYKRMTNADRIRAMTDEELASLFDGWIQDCDCNAVPCQENCELFDDKTCFMRWLDWLKQEVKDNG